MRISDWSSDVCSSDLAVDEADAEPARDEVALERDDPFEQRERRIGCIGEVREMTLDRIIGELLQMLGPEMRGEELEGADADVASGDAREHRSEERRGGKECVSTVRCRWSQEH